MNLLAVGLLLCGLSGIVLSLRLPTSTSALRNRITPVMPRPTARRAILPRNQLVALRHNIVARRRRRTFRNELPQALSLLANAVSAGHSLSTALRMTAEHSPGVVGIEWRRAIDDADIGIDLFDALDQTAARMRSDEMRWVVIVLRINREIGGEVTTVIRPVRDAMRDRAALRQKARALTAEGRLSAVVLGVLPFAFGGFLVLTRPDYLAPLVRQPLGITMTVISATLLVAGLWWMRLLIGDEHR